MIECTAVTLSGVDCFVMDILGQGEINLQVVFMKFKCNGEKYFFNLNISVFFPFESLFPSDGLNSCLNV